VFPAFILLMLLSGGAKTTALAYRDALATDAVEDPQRFAHGIAVLRRAGRLLLLWCGIGFFIGVFLLINNLDVPRIVGSSIHFSHSCVWMAIICRALFVHPAVLSLENRIAIVDGRDRATPPLAGRQQRTAWIYLLALFLLPVISICLFLIIEAEVLIFVIPAAALITPISAIFVCALGVGFRRFAGSFKAALYGNEQSANILKRFGLISIEMGIAGFFMKLIIMLASIEEPELILGQFILGLVPVFYGVFVYAILSALTANRFERVRPV
jgi:hypothetical protein